MKKSITLIATILVSFFAISKEKDITSKINSVIVYPSNAQIERLADYYIDKGEHQLIINDVSPYIDPNTLQVKASGNALILDAQFKVVYPKPNNANAELPDKIKKSILLVEDSIAILNTKMEKINMELEIWNTQKNMMLNNGTMKGQGKVNDSIPLLKDALAFYSAKMTEIKKAEFELNQQKKKLNTHLSEINKRLNELKNYHSKTQPQLQNKTRYQIILTVLSEQSTSGKINVKYVVSQAGWMPSYDLIQSNGSDKIQLNFKAQITQNTGENWENVPLTLATNNPSNNKNKPTLNTWYLNQQQQYLRNERNRSRMDDKKTSAPGSTLKDMESVADEVNYNQTSTANYTRRVEQLIHANYEINLKYTIPSDNETHHVLIAKEELETQYKHYVVPKLDLSTYLVAEVTGWGDLQLQNGEANIYFDGSFVGKTQINPNIMDDTLQLSLGQDPSVVVKRKLVTKNSKEKLIGDKKVQTVAYLIEYKNQKSHEIELIVQDQIPVAQSDEFEIELVKDDKAEVNEITGLLTWDKKIKAYGSGKIEFEYTVKTDKTNHLSLQ